MAWSGGKNAAHALSVVRRDRGERVEGLLTWLDDDGRVEGSEVPLSLLEEQVRSVGLEHLSAPARDRDAVQKHLSVRGIEGLVFGDAPASSTLEAHVAYANDVSLQPIFPFAEQAVEELARDIADGVRSVLTVVDARRVPRSWVGRVFGASLLDERPEGMHPTGGAGEFESFACGAPVLTRPLSPRWVDLEHHGGWARARLEPGPRRGYGD